MEINSSRLLHQLFLIFLSVIATFSQSQQQSLTLKCKYEISNYNGRNFYTCYAIGLENHHENIEIDTIEGSHLKNYDESKVEALIIKNQNVSFLPNGFGEIFKNLIRLEVTESQLKEIKKSSFNGMNLETLKIRKNLIKNIENGAFDSLENLKELNLDKNEIENFSTEVFTKVLNLESFSIENNKIKELNENFCKNLPNLQDFYVRHNKIEKISSKVFENCENLKTLDFSNNKLSQISSKIIENLNFFDFSNNSCIINGFYGTNADGNFDENSTFIEKLEELCGQGQSRIFKIEIQKLGENNEILENKNSEEKEPKIYSNEEKLENNPTENQISSATSDDVENFKEEIQDLNSKLSNLETENENLKSNIEEKNLKIENLEMENENLRTEKENLKEQISSLKEENDKLQNEIEETNKNSDIGTQIEKLEFENSKLEAEIEEFKAQNQKLTSEIEKKEEELKNSKSLLQSCEISKESLRYQNEEINQNLRNLTNEILITSSNFDKCKEENTKHQSETENLTRKIPNLERQNEEMQTEIESLRKISDEKTRENFDISRNFSNLEAEYLGLRREKEDLEYDLQIYREKVVYFEKNYREKLEEISKCPEAPQSQVCCNELQIYKSVPLECDFDHIELEYSCKSTSLVIIHRHMSISETRGNHITRFIDNSNVKRLHVIDAIFKFFTNDIFNHFESIQSLEIINSQLLDLNDDKIKNENLKFLRIEGNLVDKLEDEIFSGIKNVEILILSSNKINNVEPLAFTGLFNLKKLDLKNNEIASLHQNVFADLKSLTHISLSNNQLQYLQGNLLANQKNLLMVKFNENPIISIGNELLKYAYNLENVDFARTCVGHSTIKGIEETKLRIEVNCKF
ncbi:hypothetical protein PVAND_015870 [Polypedilum vanderplanki]|uniref:Uncharacterized protein n=1 Tax=Polypedilum vanderplanki TaxID=319348 RepID=A0A9J6BDE8_POLVA|nr:hypothetical protein PVAND_015870 [Polypedilum vanderplanki]